MWKCQKEQNKYEFIKATAAGRLYFLLMMNALLLIKQRLKVKQETEIFISGCYLHETCKSKMTSGG